MNVTRKSRLTQTLNTIVFYCLTITIFILSGWISNQYFIQTDWTANSRNSLSEASIQLLNKLDKPVTITAFARENPQLRSQIQDLVNRYKKHKTDLKLSFINPDLHPAQVREAGIQIDGELIINYQEKQEHVLKLSEQNITNALQRVSRAKEHWLVFLEGHGERHPDRSANHDVSDWVKQLRSNGFKAQALNLATSNSIPDNTGVLIIASPQVNLLPGEIKQISDYIDAGGNFLWLQDPGELHGMKSIANKLDLDFIEGVIVDPATQVYGIDQPDMAIISDYPSHPVNKDFKLLTLFPQAVALNQTRSQNWQVRPILKTGSQAWSEAGELNDTISFSEEQGDIKGPLTIALSLQREINHHSEKVSQRIIVIGDGDFVANAYLGNAGNLDYASNLINWLVADDYLISIPNKTAVDTQFSLSETSAAIIGLGHLMVIPVLLLGSGITIWLLRRRK